MMRRQRNGELQIAGCEMQGAKRPTPSLTAPLGAVVGMMLLSVAAFNFGAARAAEPIAEKALEYRRYFVPSDRPQDWPRRDVKYIPVDRQEFDRLIDAAGSAPRGRLAANTSAATRAQYRATLGEHDALRGEARLEIPYTGDTVQLATLNPFGLALSGARWDDGTAVTLGGNNSGKLAVVVDRRGTLVLDWSLRGRRDSSGSLLFAFEVPAAAVCRLDLDLPGSLVASMAEGLATGDDDGRRQGKWRFELGGRTRALLKLDAKEGPGRPRRLALLHEKTTYRLSPGGLDVAAQLKLDVHRDPLRRLELDLEPHLRVVSVQYGGLELAWSSPPGTLAGETGIVVDFPEPLLGTGKVVTVTALAPLVVGPAWKLPRLRVRDVTWQEGDMTLLVPAPLALDALLPRGCRQTRVSQLSGVASGDSIELQLFSADASAEVQVSRRRQQGVLASGTTLRIAAEWMRGEFRGSFGSSAGETFLLRADITADWQIETVTADRPGAIASWSVNRTARPSLLIVHLAQPVTAPQPLLLTVTGRRAMPAERRFSSAMLKMLDFHEVAGGRRLVALEAGGGQRISLDGADRPRLEQRSELTDLERGLLAPTHSDVIFQVDADRPDWHVALQRQTPRYTCDLRVTAEVVGPRLIESYRIQCRPDGASVDQMLVAFSQPREETVRFSAGGLAGTIVAERLDEPRQAARGLPQAGEVWLVRLPQAVDRPFDLRASRTVAFTKELAPALISLPDAANQQGTIEIRCGPEPPLLESAARLEPVPSHPPAEGESAVVRAAFRYHPLDELGNAPAALVLRPWNPSNQPALASVWRLRLESCYGLAGESHHRAVFDIENDGRPQCAIRLPAGAERLRAQVDGTVVEDLLAGGELTVALPPMRQFPCVVVEFSFQGSPLGLLPSCRAMWPAIDLPVTSREWIVSAPGQFRPLIWTSSGTGRPRRLLGSLIKEPGKPPFDPTSLADWRKLLGTVRDETPVTRRATRLLQAMGATLCAGDPPPDTLGSLLLQCAAAQPVEFKSLQIDSRALAALDVGPSSPLVADSNVAAPDRHPEAEVVEAIAAQQLLSLGVALLIDGDEVALTSRWSAESAGQPLDGGRSVVFTSAQRSSGFPSSDASPLLSLSAWHAQPETLWGKRIAAFGGFLSSGDFDTYRIDSGDRAEASIRWVRHDMVIAAALALAALFMAGGGWLIRRRPVLLPMIIGLAAFAASWIPPALLPLASGALAGSIVAGVWWLLQPTRDPAKIGPRPPASADSVRTTSSIVGAVLLLTLTADVRGDEAPEPDSSPVYRIFIPVDADGKQGNQYQVPADFLEEIRRRASQASDEPRGALIASAAYRCTLRRQGDGEIGVREFVSSYELQVLSPDVRVRIAANRQQADLRADSATLDGRPLELRWDESGESLTFDVAEPGVYQLQFSLNPVVGAEPEKRGLQLSVPPVAASTLDVVMPAELATVEIPGMKGDLTISESGRRMSARLGPVETLVVRWPVQGAAVAEAEVEELLWLKVRPGSVVLDVGLSCNVISGVLRQVEFAADRRLRLLLGGSGVKERIVPPHVDAPDAPQTTHLELDQPATDHLSLRLSFLLTGTSGVGNIRLPSFHTVNGRVVRRWLAVTVDPGLEYEARDAEQLDALPAAEFAAKWGEADSAVLRDALVYRLGPAETAWSLATRSREPQTTVKEVLSLSFQPTRALVRYDAQLLTTAGFVFQHRLVVPPDLEIERIVLEEEGVDRLARWARGEQGIVTLFLSRRITGSQQVTMWGRLPVRANGRMSLPIITLDPGTSAATIERAEVLDRTVHLYRQPAVRIALQDSAGLAEVAHPLSEPWNARLGRLVLSRAADQTSSGTIVVSANAPRIAGLEQYTVLRYLNQSWTAEFDYRFQVEDGLLDALSFDLPSHLAENVEVLSPPSAIELSDQPDKGRKVLIVRPLKPLTDRCQVKMRTPLKYLAGEPVTAPDVVVLGMPAAERYWLLPRQVGLEAVTWDVQRLVPASIADGAPPLADAAGFAVFRAVGDPPHAVMSAVKPTVGAGRVRLADVRVECGAQGCCGAAAFDLEPGGRASCRLLLADGWRLLRVSVGGMAAAPLAKAMGAWEVPLRSDRLPQRLEVTFSRAAPAPLALPLPVASLESWTVEETLLTVVATADYTAQVDASPVDATGCDSARLASALSLIDLPDEIVATTSQDDLACWYHPWARWLVSCGRRMGVRRPVADEQPSGGKANLAFDTWLRLARRLHAEDLLYSVTNEQPWAVQSTDVWRQVYESAAAARFRWTGPNGPKQIELRRSWRGDSLWRWTASACITLIVVAAVVLPRFTAPADVLRRWPHLVGVSLGLIWWLSCQPSAAGWLLIAWSLAASLRSSIRPSWGEECAHR